MLPTLYRYGGFGGQEAAEGQRRFLNGPERFLRIYSVLQAESRDDPLRRVGISPHSLRAVTAELLSEVMNGIDSNSTIHIHVAEQQKEVADCIAWCGKRPIEHLLDTFNPNERWTAIHATYMTANETHRLARSGVVAGLCPTTEANLGDGIFPATDFLAAGGAMAIGSDSHITVSPAEDLRMLEYSQRLRDQTRNALADGPGRSTGRRLYEAALAGGAKSMAQPVGAIATGFRADITVLDAAHPALAGRRGDSALDTWLFSAGNAVVKDVYVAGRAAIADRHHREEERIAARFRATVERLNP